jgi:hypothetical protein
MAGDHQTPEYRIAEDARLATDLPIDLVLGLFSSFLTAMTFIGILWTVGDSLVINLGGSILSVPGYLVIAVIVYSVLLSAATLLIARHLTRVMEETKRTEAELRSIGTHLRESGEGTALADGKKRWAACRWRGIEGGDRHLANLLLATDAVDTDYVHEPLDYTRRRLAAVYPEISCGNHDPRRSRPGSRSVRLCARRVQLVHRQLRAPCRVGFLRQPRGVSTSRAGSDGWQRRSRRGYLPRFRQCPPSDFG